MRRDILYRKRERERERENGTFHNEIYHSAQGITDSKNRKTKVAYEST